MYFESKVLHLIAPEPTLSSESTPIHSDTFFSSCNRIYHGPGDCAWSSVSTLPGVLWLRRRYVLAILAHSSLQQSAKKSPVAYQLASEAKGLEKDHGFIRVRFKTEQHRLLDWARVAGIAESDGIFLTNSHNRTVAMDVLDQQYQIIMNFKSLDARFRLFVRDIIFQEEPTTGFDEEMQTNNMNNEGNAAPKFPENSELLKMALKYTEKTRKLPKRLRWVISDRAKMENLLSRLAGMNDFLRDMLDSYRGDILRTQQIRTNYDIIQLNTKMDQLIEIIKAGSTPASDNTRGTKAFLGFDHVQADKKVNGTNSNPNTESLHHLVKLAQFKAVACAVQGDNLDGSVRSKIRISNVTTTSQSRIMVETSALILDMPETMLSAQGKVTRRVTGWYNPLIPGQKRRRIWVEWHPGIRGPHSAAPSPVSSGASRLLFHSSGRVKSPLNSAPRNAWGTTSSMRPCQRYATDLCSRSRRACTTQARYPFAISSPIGIAPHPA